MLAIWFGANDAALPSRAQHNPIPDFTAHLRAMIDLAPARCPVLLLTPPPISEPALLVWVRSKYGPDSTLDRKVEVTASYAHAVRQLAAEADSPARPVVLVDLYTALEDEARRIGSGDREVGLSVLLEDGLHLAAPGYKVVSDTLLAAIRTHLPTLAPEALERVFPAHSDIDPSNPALAFAAAGWT